MHASSVSQSSAAQLDVIIRLREEIRDLAAARDVALSDGRRSVEFLSKEMRDRQNEAMRLRAEVEKERHAHAAEVELLNAHHLSETSALRSSADTHAAIASEQLAVTTGRLERALAFENTREDLERQIEELQRALSLEREERYGERERSTQELIYESVKLKRAHSCEIRELKASLRREAVAALSDDVVAVVVENRGLLTEIATTEGIAKSASEAATSLRATVAAQRRDIGILEEQARLWAVGAAEGRRALADSQHSARETEKALADCERRFAAAMAGLRELTPLTSALLLQRSAGEDVVLRALCAAFSSVDDEDNSGVTEVAAAAAIVRTTQSVLAPAAAVGPEPSPQQPQAVPVARARRRPADTAGPVRTEARPVARSTRADVRPASMRTQVPALFIQRSGGRTTTRTPQAPGSASPVRRVTSHALMQMRTCQRPVELLADGGSVSTPPPLVTNAQFSRVLAALSERLAAVIPSTLTPVPSAAGTLLAPSAPSPCFSEAETQTPSLKAAKPCADAASGTDGSTTVDSTAVGASPADGAAAGNAWATGTSSAEPVERGRGSAACDDSMGMPFGLTASLPPELQQLGQPASQPAHP